MTPTNIKLKELLLDSAYIIKQHISMVDDKELPLKVYNNIIEVCNSLSENTKELDLYTDQKQETATDLLLQYNILIESQTKDKHNKGFISLCNSFINDYGKDKFIKVLENVRNNKKDIKNIYAYTTYCLKQERGKQ